MLCTDKHDKGPMIQAQCSEWTEVWYIALVSLVPTRVVRVYYPLQVFIIYWPLIFVNQT